MVRRRRRAAVVIGLTVLAAAGVADAARRPPPTPPAPTQPFTIAGSVEGVHPGSARPLAITVDNPYAFAISVTGLAATVGDGGAGCGAENLIVDGLPASVVVPAGRQVVVTASARMVATAPNECQSRQFPISYAAVARRAR